MLFATTVLANILLGLVVCGIAVAVLVTPVLHWSDDSKLTEPFLVVWSTCQYGRTRERCVVSASYCSKAS